MTTDHFQTATTIYLSIFASFFFFYNSVFRPTPTGEWDDYSLPIASILNDHNFSVSLDDVAFYQELYPAWAQHVATATNKHLSGYASRDGKGYLAWYFPTYSILCIPFTLILKKLHLPSVYAFPLTNLLFLFLAVLYVAKRLRSDNKTKFLLELMLTINPIVFYIGWSSAEVFIYSMLVMGLTAWHNGWRMRAAIFISIAGTLNPVILSMGIVMIFEYGFGLFTEWRTRHYSRQWLFSWFRLADIVKYGCCYIIGIVPMAYNLYHTGHINLTASVSIYTTGSVSTLSRFLAYLFDLNFGILPYYPVLLVVSFLLLPFAIARKKLRYLEMVGTFFAMVWLYSLMTHINSGMSGIARYNAWSVSVLIFAVVLSGFDVIKWHTVRKACFVALCLGIFVSATIVFSFSPYLGQKVIYTHFTPIAKGFLCHMPKLYVPLPSTFYNRVIHIDDKSRINTPIIYSAEDGYVRKILAGKKDVGDLRAILASDNPIVLSNIMEKVGKFCNPSYVSLRRKDGVYRISDCKLNEEVHFSCSSGINYILSDVIKSENWGTWTEGHSLTMFMTVNSDAPMLHADIVAGVYNNVQAVTAYVNDKFVYENKTYKGGLIGFDFENPGVNKNILMRLYLPDAISPMEFGYNDGRTLGLGLTKMTISETHCRKYSIGGTIDFSMNENNATKFIVTGFSRLESWGRWTNDKSAELLMECDANGGRLHADIACDTFNGRQKVNVYVNDALVFSDTVVSDTGIQFDFDADRALRFRFDFPDAVSPRKLYKTNDSRLLALGFKTMRITRVE